MIKNHPNSVILGVLALIVIALLGIAGYKSFNQEHVSIVEKAEIVNSIKKAMDERHGGCYAMVNIRSANEQFKKKNLLYYQSAVIEVVDDTAAYYGWSRSLPKDNVQESQDFVHLIKNNCPKEEDTRID